MRGRCITKEREKKKELSIMEVFVVKLPLICYDWLSELSLWLFQLNHCYCVTPTR